MLHHKCDCLRLAYEYENKQIETVPRIHSSEHRRTCTESGISIPDDLKDGNRIANTEAFSIEGGKGVKQKIWRRILMSATGHLIHTPAAKSNVLQMIIALNRLKNFPFI